MKLTFLQGRHRDGQQTHASCPTLLIIIEMQTKTMIGVSHSGQNSYHQKSKNNTCWRDGGKVTLQHCGKLNWYSHYGEQYRVSLNN